MKEPVRDKQTVDPKTGKEVAKSIHGVTFRESVTHTDDRGTLFEMFDPRWKWHKDPLTYVYACTIRPGITKGWSLHKKTDDRYFLMYGELEVVLYDGREDSPTFGMVQKVYLTEANRRLMSIPVGVWHAVRCIGQKDAVLVNFKSTFYDHKNPDKYRLPLNDEKIPYKFDNPKGY